MKDIVNKHRARLSARGYTDDQAADLIHKVSNILLPFIDAAWGVHSAQLAGSSTENKSLPAPDAYDTIGTKPKQSDEKGSAASSADDRWTP